LLKRAESLKLQPAKMLVRVWDTVFLPRLMAIETFPLQAAPFLSPLGRRSLPVNLKL
jgi:hypothetical protein